MSYIRDNPRPYALDPATEAAAEIIPYDADPLQALAEHLLACPTGEVLDLRRAVVLVPHAGASTRFRRLLLDAAVARGKTALLPPYCGTLARWITQLAEPRQPLLEGCARELLLLQALAEHRKLCQRFGTWSLVDSLLDLFDQLSLNESRIPDSPETFTGLLAEGYGISGALPAPLSEEAELAYHLWNAWHQQLALDGVQDTTALYLGGLEQSLATLSSDVHIYLAGFVLFDRAESAWIKALQARGQATILLHGQGGASGYHPERVIAEIMQALAIEPTPARIDNPFTNFLNQVFALESGDLRARGHRQAQACPVSPACGRLTIHESIHFEDEARAIDVQVRRWLLQGLGHIGIVTNDRKLARRVRALLERADVTLQDSAGWTLSTTSAATAVMRWIECLEQDFAYRPLLDLLKSPFVSLHLPPAERLQRVAWLEQYAILRSNVTNGLRRYGHALAQARSSLTALHGEQAWSALHAMLATIEHAARPLLAIMDNHRRLVAAYLVALRQSLDALGITSACRQDEAGAQVLAVLEDLRTALVGRQLQFTWTEFGEWLRRQFERRRFQPAMRGGGVQLMGFAESRLYRFDGVIIGGALRDHLPGRIDGGPLFNEAVRAQLGLRSLQLQQCALFHDFRRLLQAAPRVLVTLRREQEGEIAIASPWVERLRAFHRIAYGTSLDDPLLAALSRSPATEITRPRADPRPPPRGYPAPSLPAALARGSVSSTAHQCMVDCPYQYYAAYGLALAPVEDVRAYLRKREYGQRVHKILQAFHIGTPELPGPFQKRLTQETLAEARLLLTEISAAVFAADIRESVLARGWLYRWERLIDDYLAWQLQRECGWSPHAAELSARRTFFGGDMSITLAARIDRLDRSDHGYSIVDYKTGATPDLPTVMLGEHVQLPFYRLVLDEAVSEARFLEFSSARVASRVGVAGEALDTLADTLRTRLLRIHKAVRDGAPLSAWGDDRTCARCAMQGLCRKEMWQETTKPSEHVRRSPQP